jgi:hypothetical protein
MIFSAGERLITTSTLPRFPTPRWTAPRDLSPDEIRRLWATLDKGPVGRVIGRFPNEQRGARGISRCTMRMARLRSACTRAYRLLNRLGPIEHELAHHAL